MEEIENVFTEKNTKPTSTFLYLVFKIKLFSVTIPFQEYDFE